jgi:hypothetical protein
MVPDKANAIEQNLGQFRKIATVDGKGPAQETETERLGKPREGRARKQSPLDKSPKDR